MMVVRANDDGDVENVALVGNTHEERRPLWEHAVPLATCSKLIAGNALTGLPATLCVGTASGRVQIYGEDDSAPIAHYSMNASVSALSVLNVRHDAPRILAGDNAGHVGLFQLEAPAEDPSSQPLTNLGRLHLYESCVTSVSVCPFRGGLGVAGSEEGKVDLIHLERMQTQTIPSRDAASVNDICFWSPDAVAVAGSSPGGVLRVWDARSPTMAMQSLPDAQNANTRQTSLAVHPSVPYQLACGDALGGISLWDLRTQRCSGRLVTHQDTITGLTFHPDRPQILLSASDDGMVRAMNVQTPSQSPVDPLYSFQGMACTSVDVCSDELSGPLLMAGGEDETIILTPLLQVLPL
ncbi:WD repeat-containing protein 55 [Hondaea fermentalgiana]|uniref:WD repeat-containing protein 55 n=1 Tax=Hondaea fermentalgiana TaxID=2315210 RepID=A0A2R5G579_9STRA|nr:WD repeat-containing protein 55 [Hondaea fermentalgiana]|eukprot:GBG26130.1 WD repeat-containing protein 55 [Hondaea fermentalgiana]